MMATELKFIIDVDIPSIVEQLYRDESDSNKDMIVKLLSIKMNKCCQKIIDDYAETIQHNNEHNAVYKAGYRNGCKDTLHRAIQCLERNADAYNGDLSIYDAINCLRVTEESYKNET